MDKKNTTWGGARERAGRKKGVRTATTHIMQIRLQQEDYKALLKMAESIGTKPATLARRIIHANLLYAATR